jgi:hypothetical protein
VARAGILNRLIERAERDEADDELRLLAAACLLQVEDGARLGRDRVAGVANVAAPGFRGDHPVVFAEYVADAFLNQDAPPDAGEVARLRVLLLAAAFDAGLKPRDLIDLWAVAPNLRRVMAIEPLHRLGLLHGLWSIRQARRWERVAPADSVYELARNAPNISGRVLGQFPDLLLFHRPDADTDRDLGPVLVCSRGVVVGGQTTADPDAEVRVAKGGRLGGGYELVFGPHRLRLSRKPPDDFIDTVRGWLRFRASALLPYIDSYLTPGSRDVNERVLGPFRRRCSRCGTVSGVAAGKVGVPVRSGNR